MRKLSIYTIITKALPVTVGGLAPDRLWGHLLAPCIFGKGGLPMITYSDLIQTGILVVGIIGLFIAANKKK